MTITIHYTGPAHECPDCTLIWVPPGDWGDPCPRCRLRSAPSPPAPHDTDTTSDAARWRASVLALGICPACGSGFCDACAPGPLDAGCAVCAPARLLLAEVEVRALSSPSPDPRTKDGE